MNDDVKRFCYNYNATVNQSSQKFRRPTIQSLVQSPAVFEELKMTSTLQYTEVPCVSIHMPEDRFGALVEHDLWIKSFKGDYADQYVNSAAVRILKTHERESIIRHSNSAVQAAYEQYQTLLNLVESKYD